MTSSSLREIREVAHQHFRDVLDRPGRAEHVLNTRIFLPDSRVGLVGDFLMLVGSAYKREAYEACCINANGS